MSSLIPKSGPTATRNQAEAELAPRAADAQAEARPQPSAKPRARPGCLKTALVAVLCLVYVLSPVDILPDVIPVVGWIDDVLVVLAALGFITHQTIRQRSPRA